MPRVLKRKKTRYDDLLGSSSLPPAPGVYAERSAIHYPTARCTTPTRPTSPKRSAGANNIRQEVHRPGGTRKGATFFFNGLDADGFDEVIDPVVIEPVVQFTLFLKVKYEIEPAEAE